MTNEEMQSTMQFIVEQQAQFAANIQKLQEEHVRAEKRATKADQRLDTLTELALNFDSRMDRITESQTRTETNLEALTTIVGDIGRKVDRLAETVERYISEGRNGHS